LYRFVLNSNCFNVPPFGRFVWTQTVSPNVFSLKELDTIQRVCWSKVTPFIPTSYRWCCQTRSWTSCEKWTSGSVSTPFGGPHQKSPRYRKVWKQLWCNTDVEATSGTRFQVAANVRRPSPISAPSSRSFSHREAARKRSTKTPTTSLSR
jgi:hypothetical protein